MDKVFLAEAWRKAQPNLSGVKVEDKCNIIAAEFNAIVFDHALQVGPPPSRSPPPASNL